MDGSVKVDSKKELLGVDWDQTEKVVVWLYESQPVLVENIPCSSGPFLSSAV